MIKQKILIYIQKMKHALFPDISQVFNEDQMTTDNPYLAARQEWNFRYGDIIKAKYNWQRIAFLFGMINLLLLIGFIILASESRYIPYAVKVDSLGNAEFASLLNKPLELSPLVVNATLRRYITESRSVLADTTAQKQQLDFVYAMSLGEARGVLDDFYRTQNPFDTAKNETIEVIVNTVLPKSSTTWQIDWTERHHDLDGHLTTENHFSGLLTFSQHKPANVDDLNINPLGIYITNLSWASQE